VIDTGFYYWGRLSYATGIKNRYFLCRLFKTVVTNNENPFLMSVGIIDRHYKKYVSVTINCFSSSDVSLNLRKYS
jgi:hypothetical protein